MKIIVGLILFVLGGFVGICLTVLAFLAYFEAQKHLAAGKSAVQTQANSSLSPLAVIPITLDKDRVVAVGMNQALQEEAARIAKLN